MLDPVRKKFRIEIEEPRTRWSRIETRAENFAIDRTDNDDEVVTSSMTLHIAPTVAALAILQLEPRRKN
jgi:hypothetical protein